MLVANFIKMGRDFLELLSTYDIKTDDYKYVDMYVEYEDMKRRKLKTSYAVAVLSKKYKMSESSIYRVVRRFRKPVKS